MSEAPVAVFVDGQPGGVLSPLDRGLHYGDGLFETIACVGGRPRLLRAHLARLAAGCARLDLPLPAPETLAREVAGACAGSTRAVLKLIVTRGVAEARGYAYSVSGATRILLRYGWADEDPALSAAGVRVRLGELRLGENPALAGLKHLNRLEQVLARREWSDPSIAESLLFSHSGALVCGTMSNLFLVRAGSLCTPRLDRCGVAGVMRATVAGLARAAGIDCAETPLAHEDLGRAQELFLTSALIGIRPVRELAGRALAIGPVTRTLQAALAAHLAREGGA